MGTYLIPGAKSVQEAADHVGEPPLTARWGNAPGGVRFEDTALTDAACAALYADYIPLATSEFAYVKPNPPEVQEAIDRVITFWEDNPVALNAQQTAVILHDVVTFLRYLHERAR